jgi:hypothetical protein
MPIFLLHDAPVSRYDLENSNSYKNLTATKATSTQRRIRNKWWATEY